eukprot:TRINITY_DN55592_c0_g1_i1.p3 TRINITY_DN55592_c0_g1~~TRINITY_DN55592_c0_g1_i1.p3  ORF type:complete len:102 (-),score=6.01 TRINITY_DN55592_c0_g1_i1:1-306(-)
MAQSSGLVDGRFRTQLQDTHASRKHLQAAHRGSMAAGSPEPAAQQAFLPRLEEVLWPATSPRRAEGQSRPFDHHSPPAGPQVGLHQRRDRIRSRVLRQANR